MEEIWKLVPGFEDKYSVSSLGRVINIQRNREIYPSTSKTNPYARYHLALGSSKKSWTIPVHRLVAMTFLPNPDNLPEVHHVDHNKGNNKLDNLQWVSHSENVKAAIAAGKHHGGFKVGTKHHCGKYTNAQVRWMRQLHEDGYSYTELEEIFNINRGTLSLIINRKTRILTKQPGGFMVNCKTIPVPVVCPQTNFNIKIYEKTI